MHARRKAHEVNGRTEEEGVGFFGFRKEGRQVVFYDTRAVFLVFALTVKTTDTAFIIQGVEVDVFGVGPGSGGAFQASFKREAVLPLRRGLPLNAMIFIVHHPSHDCHIIISQYIDLFKPVFDFCCPAGD